MYQLCDFTISYKSSIGTTIGLKKSDYNCNKENYKLEIKQAL